MTTLSSHSLNKYISKVDGLSSGAQLTQFITSILNDPEVYVFGEIVESEKVKSVCSERLDPFLTSSWPIRTMPPRKATPFWNYSPMASIRISKVPCPPSWSRSPASQGKGLPCPHRDSACEITSINPYHHGPEEEGTSLMEFSFDRTRLTLSKLLTKI